MHVFTLVKPNLNQYLAWIQIYFLVSSRDLNSSCLLLADQRALTEITWSVKNISCKCHRVSKTVWAFPSVLFTPLSLTLNLLLLHKLFSVSFKFHSIFALAHSIFRFCIGCTDTIEYSVRRSLAYTVLKDSLALLAVEIKLINKNEQIRVLDVIDKQPLSNFEPSNHPKNKQLWGLNLSPVSYKKECILFMILQ